MKTDTLDQQVISDVPARVHRADQEFTDPTDVRVVINHEKLIRSPTRETSGADIRPVIDLGYRLLDSIPGCRPDIGFAIDYTADRHRRHAGLAGNILYGCFAFAGCSFMPVIHSASA